MKIITIMIIIVLIINLKLIKIMVILVPIYLLLHIHYLIPDLKVIIIMINQVVEIILFLQICNLNNKNQKKTKLIMKKITIIMIMLGKNPPSRNCLIVMNKNHILLLIYNNAAS